MEKFLSGCALFIGGSFLAMYFVTYFYGILLFLFALSILHGLYVYRIIKFSEAKESGKYGKLDEVRQGVETRMIVSFLYLLFLDFVFYYALRVVDKDVYDMRVFSRTIDGAEAGIFIFMMLGGVFLSVYSAFSMMQTGHETSEVKKYLLALSVGGVSGGLLGYTLLSIQYIVLPFSQSAVMVFSVKSIASIVACSYVVASFFSARYSCKTGDTAAVYFLGVPLYRVVGHGDVVVPLPSLTLQLLLDLAKQNYFFFSVDFEAVRQPLAYQAPDRRMTVRVESGDSLGPVVNNPSPAPVRPAPQGGGRGSLRSLDDLVHPFVKMERAREAAERAAAKAAAAAKSAIEAEVVGRKDDVIAVSSSNQGKTSAGVPTSPVVNAEAVLAAEIEHRLRGANVVSMEARRAARAAARSAL